MAKIEPWIDQYQVRQWETVEINIHTEAHKEFEALLEQVPDSELYLCNAESQWMTQNWWRFDSVENLFFSDMEQTLSLEWERHYGCAGLYRLTQDWGEYKAGTLVWKTYKGMDGEVEDFCHTFAFEVTA